MLMISPHLHAKSSLLFLFLSLSHSPIANSRLINPRLPKTLPYLEPILHPWRPSPSPSPPHPHSFGHSDAGADTKLSSISIDSLETSPQLETHRRSKSILKNKSEASRLLSDPESERLLADNMSGSGVSDNGANMVNLHFELSHSLSCSLSTCFEWTFFFGCLVFLVSFLFAVGSISGIQNQPPLPPPLLLLLHCPARLLGFVFLFCLLYLIVHMFSFVLFWFWLFACSLLVY